MAPILTHYGRALALAALLAVPCAASAQANEPLRQALAHLNAKRGTWGLSETDVRNPAVTDQYTDAGNGVTHLYLRQRVQGVEVHGAVADVHLDRSGRVRAAHSAFVADAQAHVRSGQPALSAEQAVAAAAQSLQMPAPQGLQLVQESAGGLVFSNGTISLENIPVRLVYFPLSSGELVLAWNVSLYPKDAQHFWDARIDASTGQLLDRTDYVIGEQASFAALSERGATKSVAASRSLPLPSLSPTARPNVPNSYQVFPLTTESPNHGARQLVTTPAHPVASPYGWHDTDGAAGPEFLNTRGNNVDAYEDRVNRNQIGYLPNGGPNLEFDFPLANPGSTRTNQDAAISNLFYWNNLMHDVMQRHGFTEPAGNYQVRNYSGTGLGNDAVQAEAQDGSGMNNANFSAPPDGVRGRMQMYLWQQSGAVPLRVTAPASLAGGYTVSEAGWAASLEDQSPLSGTVVASNINTNCSALTNATQLSGNVALLRRSQTCSYKMQAWLAQRAGARMVIFTDSLQNPAPSALPDDPTVSSLIVIPVLQVTKQVGDRFRTAPVGELTVTGSIVRRDGDFDNGIIAHEYGHGISVRLTGGPSNSSCLSGGEQMGEGWSDFFSLWMTTRPGDVGTTARGMGTYALFQPTTGAGIRRRPYSTDMAVNSNTYALIGTSGYTIPHSIGEVWATVLWDLNWALIGRHGYNTDLYATTGGNNIALQLVLDGCKLQPCRPGFVDGRNAILKADSLNNNAANADLIWRVFARRGMGFSARQGSSLSVTDQTEAYDLPAVLASKSKQAVATLAVFPNPAQDRVTVRQYAATQKPSLVELLSPLGQVVQRHTASPTQLLSSGVELNTAALPTGLYVVRVTGVSGISTQKVLVQH